MKKLFKFFSITGILSVLLVVNVFAGGEWIKNANGKWQFWQFYKSDSDSAIVTGTKVIMDNDGVKWYIKNGFLEEGKDELITIDSFTYHLCKDGRLEESFWFKQSDWFSSWWVAYNKGKQIKSKWVNSNVTQVGDNWDAVHCYYIKSDGRMQEKGSNVKIVDNYFNFDSKGVASPTNNNQQGWVLKAGGNGNEYVLYDKKGNILKSIWANEKGTQTSKNFVPGSVCYYANELGELNFDRQFQVGNQWYEADKDGRAKKIDKPNGSSEKENKKENKKDNTSDEKKDQNSNSSDLNTKPDGSLPKNPNEGWVDLGNGDWALYLAGSYIKGQWFEEGGYSNNWYYLNSKGIMLRNCYVYPANSSGSKLTLDSTKAVTTASGEPIKYYFNNNGAWSLSNIINVDGTDLSQLPPAQALSFLTKQEKKDIKNKKDEDVENEIAIPIEIYTKDQFYKGKFSTGQISENEYLTNGYYIYNKGNGKYTLYKANDTIGKTSKAIKSNTTLAKITDYLDDNDIEKSAEIKAKEGSSSSKDKSSSKISKKITVTIKSGYKTKDKQSITIDYEGSYTLPTFEEMNWEEKPKYTFSHWAIGSKKYNPGDTIDNIKSKKTITAKWKKN